MSAKILEFKKREIKLSQANIDELMYQIERIELTKVKRLEEIAKLDDLMAQMWDLIYANLGKEGK